MSAAAVLVAATGAAVAALLAAEARGSRAGVWMAKPLASAGFLALALERGAPGSRYGRAVLLALALGWVGDVLLIPKGARTAFAAGLASFLLGHVAFAAAFAVRGLSAPWLAAGAAAAAAGALLVLRWLGPHLPPALRLPVRAYVAVGAAMVAAAAGAFGTTREGALLAGAVAFFVSDLAVARERFVVRSLANKAWGLPLYYAAQLLLASTVQGVR